MSVTWKTIAGYEGLYEVSDRGRVRNVSRGRIRSVFKKSNGYLGVTLYLGGKSTSANVHRLVALAFTPGQGIDKEVNHRDGNRANNCAANLEWITRSENMTHSYRVLGRRPNRMVPVTVGGVWFPTMLAAAKAHDTTIGAVTSALSRGNKFFGKEIRRVQP